MDDDIFQHIKTVFSLKLPQCDSKLDDLLTENISKYTINTDDPFFLNTSNKDEINLKSSDQIEQPYDNDKNERLTNTNDKKENIIDRFILKITDRFDLLTLLINNSKLNCNSPNNQLIFSTLYLQSFSSLFFIDFNAPSNQDLNNILTISQCDLFIQTLSQSIVLNPDFFDLAYRSFSIFYNKFSFIDEINDILLTILNHSNNFIINTKKIPNFFIHHLIKVSTQLLHLTEKVSNQEVEKENPKILSHFENISKILSIQNSINDLNQEEKTKISDFISLSSNFAIFFNFNELSQSIIKFCFDLSLFTGVSFNQIFPLFENIIQQNEFSDSEVYETDFQNISDFESKSMSIFNSVTFSHKFEPLFNILNQIQDKKIVIQFVLSMTKDNIFNGNLDDFLFLLLFINKNIVDDSMMIEFLKKPLEKSEKDLFSILIPESIYQNTIFDDINNKNLLLLKCVGIEIYQKLAKVNLKLYKSLFELFTNLKNSEKSFTELLIISYPVLKNNYLPDEFYKVLRFAFDKLSKYECIKTTTDFLFEIFNSKTFLYSSLNSIDANLLFCQFLNQSSFKDVGKEFYTKLFDFLNETPQKAPYFDPLLNAVKQIQNRNNFFELFYTIIESLKKSVLKFITKGILFELIQDTIMNYRTEEETKEDEECFETMFKLLELYYFDSRSLFQIDWNLITNKIIEVRPNKLSNNMYHSILTILSGSNKFNGIRYKEPTPFILIILNSNEFSYNFLDKMYQAIKNNSVQLLALYQFGIIKMLLDFIISQQNTLDNDDLFDIIMKIVVLVNKFICDRETIEKFLSVFHHLDIKNKIHYERIPKFLKYFEDCMNDNNLSPSYALRFDSLTSSILLPSLPKNCFSIGFTLFVNLLIPQFKSMISLISFISSNSFLSVYLGPKKIVVSSNHYSRPVIIPCDLPQNEMFDLKIHFKSLGEIYVQLNSNPLLSDCSQSSCKPFPNTPIETAIMLKATASDTHFKNVEGILTKILIYIGPFKQNFLAGDINDPSLFALFTPRFTDSKNHLKNLAYNYIPPLNLITENETFSEENVHNSIENNDAVFCANCESYLPSFANVFTSFSGLNDFVLFFSYEGIDVKIIQNLFSTLKFLLKNSTDLQKQMFEINGFYIITYFIKDIGPKELTIEFWENIIEFEKIITNIELMKNYFDALLLSFKPYLESDEIVLFQVMSKWSQIEPSFFLSCITFPLFCQIIYHQFHLRKVSSNIKTLLIQIMVNVSRLFGQKEMSLLCELIGKMSLDDLESALTMFQAIRAITTSYPNLHDVSINIMINDDRLMHSNHPEILCAVLQLFAQRNLKYLALLLKTQIEIPRDYSVINKFLIHLCGVFTGKSLKSLDNINEIDFNDHTIYLPVLPFILSFAFQSSSNQIEKVSKFLSKILSDRVCIQYVAKSINPLTLFLLISYAIVLSNDLVKFLVDIISTNIDLFADSYQIIDILSEEMNQGFHDYQTAIACSVILKVIECNKNKKLNQTQKSENIDVPKMIDVIFNSICFGINRSVFDYAKCSSVFSSKEKDKGRRSSSYVKSPALKKTEIRPNMNSIPSMKINTSSNSENSFPKLEVDNCNFKAVNDANRSDSENTFPKFDANNNNKSDFKAINDTYKSNSENTFPKFDTNNNNKSDFKAVNDTNRSNSENSFSKFDMNNDNNNNNNNKSDFKAVNDMNCSNSDTNLNNESSDQSTKSQELQTNYKNPSLNSTSLTPFHELPHSVSLDLTHSTQKDRRSSLVHQQSPELLYSLSFFIRKKFVLNQIFEKLKLNKFKNKRNSFGLIYKNKDVWADMKTVELLMTFLDESSLPAETSTQLCVMLSFLCHNKLFSTKKIIYMLNLVAERYDINEPFLSPLINEVSLHVDDFKKAFIFLKKFESVLTPSLKLYEESTNFMNKFVNSLHPISKVSEKLAQLFSFEMEEIQIMDIDSYFLDLEQKELTKNNLRERMFRKLRPIYSNSTRRFNIIDNHFRPFLLTNTQQLNYKILDSPLVQEHFAQHEIWSAKCQRVKLYTKIPGDFIITKDGIRFSTTKGKSLFILKTSVRCVFWNYYHHLPNSFTFTTLKGKTFLFRFITQYVNNNDIDNEDEEKENEKFGYNRKIYLTEGNSTVIYIQTATREDVISNLKKIELNNCVFFQDSEPSTEIERLNLTQQWRTREISNFDYILWLNMLSGRSFLDVESYPIFPLLFISEDDQSLVRDLSKNASLSLSSENNRKLRERKLSDLDPYKSFLFDKASSTPELTKRFLFSIEQFRIGENAQVGVCDLINKNKSEKDETKIEHVNSGYNSNNRNNLNDKIGNENSYTNISSIENDKEKQNNEFKTDINEINLNKNEDENPGNKDNSQNIENKFESTENNNNNNESQAQDNKENSNRIVNNEENKTQNFESTENNNNNNEEQVQDNKENLNKTEINSDKDKETNNKDNSTNNEDIKNDKEKVHSDEIIENTEKVDTTANKTDTKSVPLNNKPNDSSNTDTSKQNSLPIPSININKIGITNPSCRRNLKSISSSFSFPKKDAKSISPFRPFTSYSDIIDEIKQGTLYCELPPEFFFMPEIFSNWTKFPKFAPNASSFVMKNLEALESEEVSLNIHKWIDMIWGVNQNFNCIIDPDLSSSVWNFHPNNKKKEKKEQLSSKRSKKKWLKNSLNETKLSNKKNTKKNDQDIEKNKKIHHKLASNGQIPVRLFVGPHPARGTCNVSQTKHTSFNLVNESYVRSIGVNVTNNKMKDVEIYLFHQDELITQVLCNANKFTKGIRIPFDFHHFQHVLFSGSFLCFVILGTKTFFGFDFDKKQLLIGDESPHLMEISCIDSSSYASYFASGSTDSSIVTWMISSDQQTEKTVSYRNNNQLKFNGAINPFNGKLFEPNSGSRKIFPFRTLIAHRKPIVTLKIQDEMRILLAIDESGVLSISVFPFLKLIKTIDTKIINCEKILMTRNSLVCFKGREAFNFTANGTKNGSRKFGFDIICVESIESRTRTDIIALSTSQNEIVAINSVSLKAIGILEHQSSCIILMKYNQEIDALVCYTESKKVIIVPISD